MEDAATAGAKRRLAEAATPSGLRRRNHVKQYLEAYLMIAPWILGFVAFTVVPMLMTFGLTVTQYDVLSPPTFSGLENLRRLIGDDIFRTALVNTFALAVMTVIPRLVLALSVAILLNQRLRGTRFFRTLFYLPAVVPAFSSVYMWVILMQPGSGALNVFLGWLGLPGLPWLTDTATAKPSIALMLLSNFGPQMLIFLAALQGVPNELLEAAQIDGAGAVRRFFSVTLPMITPALFFSAVVLTIDMLQIFTYPFLATQGGPVNSTVTNVQYIYQQSFQYLRFGYAGLLSSVLFVIIMLLTALQFRLSSWVYYEANV